MKNSCSKCALFGKCDATRFNINNPDDLFFSAIADKVLEALWKKCKSLNDCKCFVSKEGKG